MTDCNIRCTVPLFAHRNDVMTYDRIACQNGFRYCTLGIEFAYQKARLVMDFSI